MKKACSLLCAVLMTANLTAALPTAAASADGTEDAVIFSTGLIIDHEISVSCSNGQLRINGFTESNESMKSIGFTEIKIQQSRNGNAGWSTIQTLSDVLASDTNLCSISNYTVSVPTGYYYRVTCTHYAKESGIWFPKSESISATSNSVYGG